LAPDIFIQVLPRRITVVNPNGTTGCAREPNPAAPGTPQFTSADYIPHHAWFQYYKSTPNPTHARPSSVAAVGHTFIPHTTTLDPANHNYDINDFFAALKAGNLPSVSFVKALAFQDGHAGYSDPLDEQTFLVNVVNAIQKSPFWKDTAIVIAYDDSPRSSRAPTRSTAPACATTAPSRARRPRPSPSPAPTRAARR
jgi:hypothetical protein